MIGRCRRWNNPTTKHIKTAKAYQLFIEYDPKPPFDSGNIHQADSTTIQLAKNILSTETKKELSLWDMVKHAQLLLKLKKGNKMVLLDLNQH